MLGRHPSAVGKGVLDRAKEVPRSHCEKGVTRTKKESVMIQIKFTSILFLLFAITFLSHPSFLQAESTDSQALAWPEVVTENRPGCYWWWMGSAVDKENITWNLETMRAAGMGGGSIVPIYGAKGYEDRYIDFLTPEFTEMVSYAAKEAKRLGMWVDLTAGSGWPFGGPMITEETCDLKARYKEGELSQKWSGRKVKRAAPGNEGMAIDSFSPSAMTGYLEHFEKHFVVEDQVWPRAIYHDSYEFLGNWSKALPDEFIKRRGYDVMQHLPALFEQQGEPEMVARIKSDYRQTLSELHLEYMEVLQAWALKKGCVVRNQAHGAPANLLDLYGTVDIADTETFGASSFEIPGIRREADNVRKDFPQPIINRMASSAAHVNGHPLVASESCTWIRNHFRASLAQAKPEIDQFFLNGINHVFIHGTCYSPKDAPWPGWLFYASFEYNPRNAIWHDAPYFNAYITRCQSILQSGQPDNDVALYWPIYDIWHDTEGLQQQFTVHHSELTGMPTWLTDSTCGKMGDWLNDNGYGYDFFSDQQLIDDKINHYQAIIVPQTSHIPLKTLEKLLALAAKGTPVIFVDALPADVPGYQRIEARQQLLKKMVKGQDKWVVQLNALQARLATTKVAREPLVDAGLKFIRRQHETGTYYFVANMSAQAVDGWVTLGKPFASAGLMDPYTGTSDVATHRNGQEIYLQLLPGETRFIRTFNEQNIAGQPQPLLAKTDQKPFTVTGQWQVTFIQGQPNLPAPFKTSALESWATLGDTEAERFAGTARYAIEFDLPTGNADDWVIDLGDVRESARLIINGQKAGVLYSVPFSAKIGQYLKPGKNLLEVEVTNLSANRIRDLDIRKVEWQIFHDINFVNHNYKKFDASQWPLTPSGLLGPVTLTPMKTLRLVNH